MAQVFKIAMVAACPFPYSRGTPIRIYRLAEELSKRGHEVHVVTYHIGKDAGEIPFTLHRIPKIITYQKYSPGPTYQKFLILDVLLAAKLRQVIRHHNIDIIHAHHYEALLSSLAATFHIKIPLIFDMHTLLKSELPYYGLGLPKVAKRWIGERLDHWLPHYAAHIIAVTEDIQQQLQQQDSIPDEKISVISSGVEFQHFDRVTNRQHSTTNKDKTLVYAGNLASYQGIELMMEAFREMLNVRQDIRLLIISDTPFDKYEKSAISLGIRNRIEVVASDYEILPQHLSRADIALNPRIRTDGLPQKLLNYMASGLPIVSFAGSAKNLEHEKSGLLVTDNDIGAFAEATLRLLDDPQLALTLGANAKKSVQGGFSWEKAAEQVEAVYANILQLNEERNAPT